MGARNPRHGGTEKGGSQVSIDTGQLLWLYVCTVLTQHPCSSSTRAGQFGSERLVQQVVEQILEASGRMEQVTRHEPAGPDVSSQSAAAPEGQWQSVRPLQGGIAGLSVL